MLFLREENYLIHWNGSISFSNNKMIQKHSKQLIFFRAKHHDICTPICSVNRSTKLQFFLISVSSFYFTKKNIYCVVSIIWKITKMQNRGSGKDWMKSNHNCHSTPPLRYTSIALQIPFVLSKTMSQHIFL